MLRAIISLPPKEELLSVAKKLDRERAENKIRGPFHGIPIIIKVQNLTSYQKSKS
jgi:amidase